MASNTTIPRSVKRVLFKIRAGVSWRAANDTVEFILRNDLARFVHWEDNLPANQPIGWVLTDAGIAALAAIDKKTAALLTTQHGDLD